MLIPVLILFLTSLAAVPILTARVFGEIEEYERLTIALDNAAIRLARRDRALFRTVEKVAAQIRALEVPHHAAHTCARTPSPAMLKCRAADLAIEKSLLAIVQNLRLSVASLWKSNTLQIRADLLREGWGPLDIRRRNDAPVSFQRCPICGLVTRVSIDEERAETRIFGEKYSDSRVGIRFTRPWDYQLFYWEGG